MQQGRSSATARPEHAGQAKTVTLVSLTLRSHTGVDRAWAQGRSSASESLEGHQDFIRCMQLSGDTLVSCSGSISHVDCSIRWGAV